MSNLELWNRVSKTDPKHVKPITGKQYSGNSPKPYYIVQRLTEEFGPCGLGWGFDVQSERFERFSDTDSLHVAMIDFWYVKDGQRGNFQQMGQTKASYVSGQGKFILDEDAPKKSVTDALVKCASYLGFAGDIFMGLWDDSKYVNELRKEFAEAGDLTDKLTRSIEIAKNAKGIPLGKGVIKPTEGAGAGLSDKRRAEMDNLALEIIEAHQRGQDNEAIRYWYDARNFEDNDERVYVWSQLGPYSKLRSTIKANRPATEETKEPA